MKTGDELAMQANAKGASLKTIRSLVDHAVMAYRNAAAAKPKAAEPYYRIGRVLYSFYFECEDQLSLANASPLCLTHDINIFDRRHAQEVIAAWDAFEERAPLDPRLSVHLGETEILFKRAILNTKLAGKANLEAAAKDYEKILARSDTAGEVDETVWSNLAETYMMLGRLEDAIDMYHEALRRGPSTSTLYGLAVALDRDERTAAAVDLIQSQGMMALQQFHASVMQGHTFFVPYGEQFYYFALAHEAFGETDEAIEYWHKYIQSGAHPEFQPRAKAHLATLAPKHHGLPKAPWQELIP
jgi:tetratricopeptide (TPR) repeat protein